jgi:hypothetical protein
MRGGFVATEESRPGYYLDRHGRWLKDRRAAADRRRGRHPYTHDRRKEYRRKADRELYVRDHKQMIADALEDFAAEHSGHDAADADAGV